MAELPLIDERTGRLVAGHGRVKQLAAMRDGGQSPPDGVTVDGAGRWLVPVTRGWASRSDAEAEAYLLGSNKLTFNGGWDDTELAELLAGLAEVDPDLVTIAGFDADEMAALLEADDTDGPGGSPAGLTDPDDVPDTPVQPVSVLGDLWLLGEHRLLHGDATNPEHIDRVLGDLGVPGIVYTDPPYGISIQDKRGKVGGGTKEIPSHQFIAFAGDDTADSARDAFTLLHTAHPDAKHVWWGGNHYAASAGLPDSPCWLVWDKEINGNFADCELAWTNHPGAVRLLRHIGMIRASERGKRVHPTQKPVALAEWAFGVVDRVGVRRVVLDVFGGSGSTLIAAHRTGRTAAVIELEPAYVDVIIKRWVEFTGLDAVHVDGRSWSELAAD